MKVTLNQIEQFKPCEGGWRRVCAAVGTTPNDGDQGFLLETTLDFCTISDVTWFLSKTGNISTLVKFAKLCAGSVEHFHNRYGELADAACAYAAAAAAYAVDACTDACAYATYAACAYAADACAYTAYACADAAYAAYADAGKQQEEKNKQFMIELLAGLE